MQQNSFSPHDYNCPLYKTVGMMKAIVKFYENCNRVIQDSAKAEKKISMGFIEQTMGNNILDKINNMKFIKPDRPEVEVRAFFDNLHEEIDTKFRDLQFA